MYLKFSLLPQKLSRKPISTELPNCSPSAIVMRAWKPTRLKLEPFGLNKILCFLVGLLIGWLSRQLPSRSPAQPVTPTIWKVSILWIYALANVYGAVSLVLTHKHPHTHTHSSSWSSSSSSNFACVRIPCLAWERKTNCNECFAKNWIRPA